jgi:hypothetical protein
MRATGASIGGKRTVRDFLHGTEIEEIATELIALYHPHLQNLNIAYYFNLKPKKTKGRIALGTCEKATGLFAQVYAAEMGWDCDEFFTIKIYKLTWDQLTAAQRRALIDHELCHAWAEEDKEGKVTLKLLPHDMEEFAVIVKRHGLWLPDVQLMAEAIASAQTRLTFEESNERAAA